MKETIGTVILGVLVVCSIWVVAACTAEQIVSEKAVEQEEALVVFDGDPGLDDDEDDEALFLTFWDDEYIIHRNENASYDESNSWYDYVALTLDEVTGKIQSIEDRLSTLEKTIEACCGTDTMDPRAPGDLEVVVKLRLAMEEIERRVTELEGGKL